MFIDVKEMPEEYAHLRVRLRIEQTRCLHWGQKAGLIEEALDGPSKILQFNHNLVLDILHEMQRAFRSCLTITSKYDQHISSRNLPEASPMVKRLPAIPAKSSVLQKVLAIWAQGGRVAERVHWGMLKKGSMEKLITKLIGYNDRIESFLDRSALEDVRQMQAQSNLLMLQMTDQIFELRDLVRAMHISRAADSETGSVYSQSSTIVAENTDEDNNLISLAKFKAHYLRIEMQPEMNSSLFIPFEGLAFDNPPRFHGRQRGFRGHQRIWVEWRETADDLINEPIYLKQLDERVQELAAILSTPDKPAAFRAPDCIGYTKIERDGKPCYALINVGPQGPDDQDTDFISLRDLLGSDRRTPSLNTRVDLASILVSSVLYLHAVGWIHKDIRSDNVLFMREPDGAFRLDKPMLAGFEFSRPALNNEEKTGRHTYRPSQALYKHPDLLASDTERSKKSHDVYSLGIVLAEIAMWEPIEDVARIEVRMRYAMQLQERLLDFQSGVLSAIASHSGAKFRGAVRQCLDGSIPAGIQDEEEPGAGVEMAQRLNENVVKQLRSISI
jgi:hypothetical protein